MHRELCTHFYQYKCQYELNILYCVSCEIWKVVHFKCQISKLFFLCHVKNGNRQITKYIYISQIRKFLDYKIWQITKFLYFASSQIWPEL